VDEVVKQRAQRGLSIEKGDVDEGNGGHVRGVRDDARASRAHALVEWRVGNGFGGLGYVEDS
jgi:hypothetical protein